MRCLPEQVSYYAFIKDSRKQHIELLAYTRGNAVETESTINIKPRLPFISSGGLQSLHTIFPAFVIGQSLFRSLNIKVLWCTSHI